MPTSFIHGVSYRTGPTGHSRAYSTYEQAHLNSRDGRVHIDVGTTSRRRRIMALPEDAFTLQVRRGDLVHLVHVLGHTVRPGAGRAILEATAPWVFANLDQVTVHMNRPPAGRCVLEEVLQRDRRRQAELAEAVA